ncbi:MAG TPA: hypothetical protein VI789_00010 [Dehalococcoidia bacterium]|nr:hypothetical protein [Dehalococcoidia bacterium]
MAQITGTTYVEVEPDDHLGSLRSKLERAEGERIVVFVPRHVALLRNPVSLQLLRRIAASSGRHVLFQVQDAATRTLAREIGLPLVERRDGRMPSTAARGARAPAVPLRRIVTIGLVLLGVFVAGSLISASATVTLQPVTQMVSDSVVVTAAVGLSAVSPLEARVPGRLLETEMEVSERLTTTGTRKEPDATARGSIAFVSRVAESIVVSQGTRVATATGLQFQTMAPALLPPTSGARAVVAIESVTPGEVGNVAALSIDRTLDQSLAPKVAVLQEEATKGGTDKEVRLVGNEDLTRLRQQAQTRLRETAEQALKRLARSNESYYGESQRTVTVSESFDRQVGEVAPDIGLRLVAKTQAVAFQGSQVNAMIRERIEQDGQFKLVQDGLKTTPLEFSGRGDEWAAFRVAYSAELSPGLDIAAARSAVAGRQPAEARAYFKARLDLAKEPEITMSPPWLGTLPLIPARIEVRFASVAARPS